ncbi:MAG: hypothetical protein QOJ99_361, partial [Bryobacterales bacterium]|nr:hypothetical protein [Bryobacterales bacterium]
VVSGSCIFIAALEKVADKELNAAGACRGGQGSIAFCGQAEHEKDYQSRQRQAPGKYGCDRASVAACEFAEPVSGSIPSRFQRRTSQILVDVTDQRLGRGIPFPDIFVQSGQTEDIQIRPCPATLPGRDRRPDRIAIQQDVCCFAGRSCRQVKGKPAC